MSRLEMRAVQNNNTDRGELKVSVESAFRTVPIENATVDISYTGEPDQILEEVRTDQSGNTDVLELEAPPLEYSMEPGEIVLSRVVIPEYVIVHDGSPRDTTAGDYYVRYRDYIKNVASSEIYSTWPRETIIANVLAIMSFTLNRVYTEWYRNRWKFGVE